MKAKCIDTGHNAHLIKGKIYTILEEDDDMYRIENEKGVKTYYFKERFEIIEE